VRREEAAEDADVCFENGDCDVAVERDVARDPTDEALELADVVEDDEAVEDVEDCEGEAGGGETGSERGRPSKSVVTRA
jgi:hypothetical protein